MSGGPRGEVMTYVCGFCDPSALDRRLVGGKAANLGDLAQAAFPVPDGFTVSTPAYAAVVTSAVRDRIHELIDAIDYDDADAVERGAAAVRQLVEGAELPGEVAEAVTRAYESLGASYVAVRSSGTAEDLAEASFA